MLPAQDIRWIFFDLSNSLIDERGAIDDQIDQIRQAFAALGKPLSVRLIEHAFEQAAAEFAPRLVT
jgi:hypothetical protein